MSDNVMIAELQFKLDQADANVVKLTEKLEAQNKKIKETKQAAKEAKDELTRLGDGAAESGGKAEASFANVGNAVKGMVAGLATALTALAAIVQQLDEANKKAAEISKTTGTSTVSMSSALQGMGITGTDNEKTMDRLRATGGPVTNQQIEGLVSALAVSNAGMSGQQVVDIARNFAKNPNLASQESVAEMAALLGPDASGEQIVGSAISFGQNSGGKGLTAGMRKTIEKLTALGMTREEALGLAATSMPAGDEGGLEAILGFLQKPAVPGSGIDGLMNTQPDDPFARLNAVLQNPDQAPPELRGIAASLAQRGGGGLREYKLQGIGMLTPGQVQRNLDDLPATVRREYMLRSAERQREIAQNLNADSESGARARLTTVGLDQDEDALAAGGYNFDYWSLRAARTLVGDRATSYMYGKSKTVEQTVQDYNSVPQSDIQALVPLLQNIDANTRGSVKR